VPLENSILPVQGAAPSYGTSQVEVDHSRLKARIRPMRGLQQLSSARTVTTGHAFVQNLRRGHHELATDEPVQARVRVAFEQLAQAV
jgi:IS6 family transposase